MKESIEYAHQGCSLAGEIMQLQELEAGKFRGAESSFYVGFIAQGL